MKTLGILIKNYEINKIFYDLKNIFGPDSIPKKPHITIRGPQKSFSKKISEEVSDLLKSPEFEITVCGTDKFIVEGNYYVFLKVVDTPDLKSVWRKPDYPIKRFGYKPHITIYWGDKNTAEKIEKEYSNFKIKIKQSELSGYTKNLKQSELTFD